MICYILQSEPSSADDDERSVRELRRAEDAGRGRCAPPAQNVSDHPATQPYPQEPPLWKICLQ